ncbi:MAG: hypothetical protein AB8G14_03360 [Ilumatobacter sp.]
MPDALNNDSSAPDSLHDELDFRGSRRLVGKEEWFWYLVAALSYILLGIWHKWLLNWFVGPVWLVAVIVVGPWLTDRFGLTGANSKADEQ